MSDPLGAFLQGLVGDEETPGFRGGYGFRVGLADRKRKLANEQEDRTILRARELRSDVGARLQQRETEGQIRSQETGAAEHADRQARVRQAAAAIRQNPTLTKDRRIAPLLNLPDEELVAGVKEITTNPQRLERPYGYGAGAGGAGGADERAVIGLANRLYDPEGAGDSSGSFPTWEEAYTEALKRYQIAGRLGGHTPPPAAAGAQPHRAFDVPSSLRDYLRRQGPGPMRTVLPPGPQTPPPDPGFTAPRLGPQHDTDPGFTAPRVGNAPDTDPGFAPPAMGAAGQQRDWDAAAAFIRAHPEKYQGKRPEDLLGPRP